MSNLYDERSSSTLNTTWEFDLDYVTSARFAQFVVERALEHVVYDTWATERMTLEGLFENALSTLRDRSERAAVLDLGAVIGDDCLVHLSLIRGRAHIRAAARSVDALASAKVWLKERYPVAVPAEAQQASITFWTAGDRHAQQATRQIDVPTWNEIGDNYPSDVARELAPLMSARYRPSRGRLLLWHGEPGTGKTYALRALAWEWRDWCRFHYITDPERFFGDNARYMLNVLLDAPEEDDGEELWRLLILEDTGELLAADAKEQTGQGLSRLLNVVDGLIGQGLRVMVLVTTNETLRRLHSAVARPGRCAELIEFTPFSADEAGEWLERHGTEAAAAPGTLASLFARAAGEETREKVPVGFTR
jgi:ATPase family associated with various cellular activities (AAA)